MKLTIYDPIFNHKAIQIPIGLAGLIRLRLSGFYVAYCEARNGISWGYYLIHCHKCGFNYLSETRNLTNPEETCPICGKGEKKCLQQNL